MKKKDLLKLIEAKYKIINNEKLVEFTERSAGNFNWYQKKEDDWFPKVNDLENEFNILKKEVKLALKETKEAKDIIDNFECNHDVRLNYYELFSNTSKCIFCDEYIHGDNVCNWEYSKNRNKYCVILDDKIQFDSDGDDYIIDNGYTINQVLEIILDIIKDKNDEDDIDLIQEFKKLNLINCKINYQKKSKENFILIISGSNKRFIDDESYIQKKGLDFGLEIVDYFYGLLNTKIKLIDNTELLENKKLQQKISSYNDNVKFTNYDTIEELERILNYQKEVPFKLIIDLSELYNYKIENNSITKESYNIKLNEAFPNSHIIKINNLSKKSLEELSNFLKTYKDINNLYAYQNKKYYYIENNEIKSQDLENTCDKVKRLLKN